ncbi:MAG: hypothetical protein AAB893_02505, partial [Patescibacteria group bacterium]
MTPDRGEKRKKRLVVSAPERFNYRSDRDPAFYLERVIPEGQEENHVYLLCLRVFDAGDKEIELIILEALTKFFGEITIAEYAQINIPALKSIVLNAFSYIKSNERDGRLFKILTGQIAIHGEGASQQDDDRGFSTMTTDV